MAFALIDSNSGQGSATINSTGADLLVMHWTNYNGSDSFTDNKGNTWVTTLGLEVSVDGLYARLFYCLFPTSVGSSHTLNTFDNALVGVSFAAFSGVKATGAFDQNNRNSAGSSAGSPVTTGSITPTVDNEIVIAAVGANGNATTFSVDSGFTIASQAPHNSGFATCIAYKVQTTAAAVNPEFSWTNGEGASYSGVAAIASFKVETPPAGGTVALSGSALTNGSGTAAPGTSIGL